MYPEKKGAEEEKSTIERSSDEIAKFSIKNDENFKGTGDNLIKVEVPWIDKVEHEAETWLGNLISIHNKIFLRGDGPAENLSRRDLRLTRSSCAREP